MTRFDFYVQAVLRRHQTPVEAPVERPVATPIRAQTPTFDEQLREALAKRTSVVKYREPS